MGPQHASHAFHTSQGGTDVVCVVVGVDLSVALSGAVTALVTPAFSSVAAPLLRFI